MRTEYNWFQDRLTTSWKALPGRSALLIVPPGCATLPIAKNVVEWVCANDAFVGAQENRLVAVARIEPEAITSSAHFVNRLQRALAKSLPSAADIPVEPYAADWIESLVSNAQSNGAHPVIVIERFHKFATVADDHLLSVLSMMRQMEHDAQLTTIAISPMNYGDIRRQLSERGDFPFVNSAYGDNHDKVVLPPLSRNEFVYEAVERGVTASKAQELFAIAGGPDCVHSALIDAHLSGAEDIEEHASRVAGAKIGEFFDIAIGPRRLLEDDIRLRIATGRLQPAQEAHLQHGELSRFLLKRDKNDRLILASPVLARIILAGNEGPWVAYGRVLQAVRNNDFADAHRQAALLSDGTPHLQAFVALVSMLAAVHAGSSEGLLDMDWKAIKRTGQALLQTKLPVTEHIAWIEQLVRWSSLVKNATDVSYGKGARLDVLTRQANKQEVRVLLLYTLRAFLKRVGLAVSAGERVRTAGSVPESVLQAMCAYLGVDPLDVPAHLPDLDYQRFFGGHAIFRMPEPGSRLDLTSLLVIVPTLLTRHCQSYSDEISLCDVNFVRPLHQRLVAQLRNATAHTYAEMSETTASYFLSVCDTFLGDATAVWSRDGTPVPQADPDHEFMSALLQGRTV